MAQIGPAKKVYTTPEPIIVPRTRPVEKPIEAPIFTPTPEKAPVKVGN